MRIKDSKIFVAGAMGMVGRATVKRLSDIGCKNILTPSSKEVDLVRQNEVEKFFEANRPEIVVIAAAKVGGISANNALRSDFIYENLMIEANIVHAAYETGVKKLVLLGSSCIYPKDSPQPIREEELLAGKLEFTNEPYAVAKIAGIKLCESYYRQHACNFFSVMPTNLYGRYDNFDPETSHVIPALIRKIHDAKVNGESSVSIWGTGKPLREFMFVDDLADALGFMLEHLDARDVYCQDISHINIGTGRDITIYETAVLISDVIGFRGRIETDESRPDGTMQKLLNVSRLHKLGWKHNTELRDGLIKVYDWYLQDHDR